ncbi:hypothetical protein RhiirC2_803726 [Rhizophagus irregularis]|uniref:Uncharacterized protein n=1 Tax=Rhizophagus irregularis TaxID=588596 RepID=A0A2N1LCD1_9GLOM|nr:hypothetical protein RhiirC2_803726 [Rhizophagus irregularis]
MKYLILSICIATSNAPSVNFARYWTNLFINNMGTTKGIPKLRRKPKTNDFKSILEWFLEKYNLSTDSSRE